MDVSTSASRPSRAPRPKPTDVSISASRLSPGRSSTSNAAATSASSPRSAALSTSTPTDVVFRWPPHSPKQHYLTWDDICRIKDERYLNDNAVDLCIQYLLEEPFPFGIAPSPQRPAPTTCHIFRSFFYHLVRSKPFDSVAHLPHGVDIFEKDFLIIPIAMYGHWNLVIVSRPSLLVGAPPAAGPYPALNHPATAPPSQFAHARPHMLSSSPANTPGRPKPLVRLRPSLSSSSSVREPVFNPLVPTVYTFDSLFSINTCFRRDLTRYLGLKAIRQQGLSTFSSAPPPYDDSGIAEQEEAVLANLPDLNWVPVVCPMQTNSIDCGLFVLHYVERFLQDPAQMEQILLSQHFRRNDAARPPISPLFDPQTTPFLRARWQERILNLARAWLDSTTAE